MTTRRPRWDCSSGIVRFVWLWCSAFKFERPDAAKLALNLSVLNGLTVPSCPCIGVLGDPLAPGWHWNDIMVALAAPSWPWIGVLGGQLAPSWPWTGVLGSQLAAGAKLAMCWPFVAPRKILTLLGSSTT